MAYRVRKEGGIFSSIIGMFIGILLVVIGSPMAAWVAESQNRADDFGSATVVEETSNETGYIVIDGTVENVDSLTCPKPGDMAFDNEDKANAVSEAENCLYVSTDQQQYARTEKEVCGNPSDDQVILYETDLECDSDGTNCEQCYQVEEYDWETLETDEEFSAFTLGSYTVTPSGSSNYIGTEDFIDYEFEESKTDPLEGDIRYEFDFMSSDQNILVAGDAENSKITSSFDGKPYVISNTSYQGTLEALQAQDSTAKWGLRILSLVLMIGGMVMVFGPLMAFTNVLRFIPIVGKSMDRGFDGVIKFVAALIGFVLWVIVYTVVLLLKNIFLVIGVLAVLGIGAYFLVQKGKKDGGKSDAPAAADKPAEAKVEDKPAEAKAAEPESKPAEDKPKKTEKKED